MILESDELNRHECMATIVALIQHMVEKKIVDTSGPAPNWMERWAEILRDPKCHGNVKLFLLRVMVNVDNSELPCFQNFGAKFYGPVAMFVNANSSAGLNYFLVDLIHMTLKWTLVSPPMDEHREEFQALLNFVIRNVRHENSQASGASVRW